MKRWILPGAFAVTLLLFAIVFYRLFSLSYDPFPRLGPGRYIGYFAGNVLGSSNERVYFSVIVKEQPNGVEQQAVVYQADWQPKVVHLDNARVEELPLVLSGSTAALRFSGAVISNNYISGTVKNTSSGESSPWVLYVDVARQISDKAKSALDRILLMKAEELNLEAQLLDQRRLLEVSDAEHERLNSAIKEGKGLQQRAENRFTEKQSEISTLLSEVEKAEKELVRLQAALEVARSITQRGRLTTLAREANIREFRAIDQKLMGESLKNDAILLADLARAKEILALKQELSSQPGQPEIY